MVNVFQQNVFTKQEKGWIAMRTDIRKYLVHTTQTNRLILDYLIDHAAFDKTKAKKIKEIAEGLQLHPTYLGQALKEMYASGWLMMFKESKVIHYYVNNERANCITQTVLPESVTCEIKPIEKSKPKKVIQVNSEIQEVFDLFNEELVKQFGDRHKLKSLNPKTLDGKRRIKAIQDLLSLGLDLRTMFKGFFLERKEMGSIYLDIHYVLRHPEMYTSKASAVKQVDNHVTRERKQKYLNYIMDGKDPEQFGLNREKLGVTDAEIKKAIERYEYEKEMLS